jgi:hypothetical protein
VRRKALAGPGTPMWGVVDGTTKGAVLIDGDALVQITRQGAGSYELSFGGPIKFFVGTSQTGGPGFDAGPSFLACRYDTNRPNVLLVNIYGIGLAGPTFALRDGRFSFEVRQPIAGARV